MMQVQLKQTLVCSPKFFVVFQPQSQDVALTTTTTVVVAVVVAVAVVAVGDVHQKPLLNLFRVQI